MARMLPDYPEPCGCDDTGYPLIPFRDLADLVVVNNHKSMFIGVAAAPFALIGPRNRPLDQGQWIATTGLQEHGIEVNRKARLFDEPRKQSDITLFALTFTTDEQPTPLGYQSTRRPHPMCGTAP